MSGHQHGVIPHGPDEPMTAERYDRLCPPDTRTEAEIGGRCSTIEVGAAEWALIVAYRTGAPVRFRAHKQRFGPGDELTAWIRGSVIWAMVYDGIMAKVLEDDPDERIVWSVNPSCGDQVELVR